MAVKKLVAGKHSCIGHLNAGPMTSPDEGRLEKPALMVYCGKFESMDGEVEIEESHIDRIIENHNAQIAHLSANGEMNPAHAPPLQVDHSTSAMMTVGRVVGKLFRGEHLTADGKKVPALYGEKILVLGKENVEKVKDGRWSNLSIGADLENGVLNELSITPFPAAPHASLLSSRKEEVQNPEGASKMHEKLKKHLMEKHQMSEKEAEEMSAKMGKHLSDKEGIDEAHMAAHLEGMDDEKMSKLADDVKEEEKKLAAESDEATEGHKKMAAAKPQLIKLAKSLSKGIKKAQLSSKSGLVLAKTSQLRFSKKMTPAEQKEALVELKGKSDKEINAYLKGFEKRQPVIDSRIHGTTKAVNLAKLQKDAKLARLEAETKKDMGMPLEDKDKKALAGEPAAVVHIDTAEHEHHDEYMSHMSHLEGMLHGFDQREAVMAHVKKMMEMAKGSEHMGDEPHAGHDEKQMAEHSEELNRLQTEFQDLIKLVGDASGISSAELTE